MSSNILRDSIATRLSRRVEVNGPDDCWPWRGSVDGCGYGTIHSRHGKPNAPEKAHRVAWEIANEQEIPSGVHVCHSCDNPPCCNPRHLFLGSAKDNAADREQKNRGGDRRVFGERHGNAKLTSDLAREIVKRVQSGETKTSIAKSYGISRRTVLNIVTGSVWSQATGIV